MPPTNYLPRDCRETDVVILAVGLMKAGKSTFLNQLLGSETEIFEVGKKLAQCTRTIRSHVVSEVPQEFDALRNVLQGRRIVLIDTPGFDATYMDDRGVLKGMSDLLIDLSERRMHVGGILYIHDIHRNDYTHNELRKLLDLFSMLCGDRPVYQAAFVTTKWGRLRNRSEGFQQVKELEQFWHDCLLMHEACLYHVALPPPSNWVASEGDPTGLTLKYSHPWDIIHGLVVSSDIRVQQRRRADTTGGWLEKELKALLDRLTKIVQRFIGGKKGDMTEQRQCCLAILVMGMSGSGKSRFINSLLQPEGGTAQAELVASRKGLRSKTEVVQEVPLAHEFGLLSGHDITLVDTPGLDHTNLSRKEVVTAIANWLAKSFDEGRRVGAVIYLQDIRTPFISLENRWDIEFLKKLCGGEAISRQVVTLATTKWSNEPYSQECLWKEDEMKRDLWAGLMSMGCEGPDRITDSNASAKALLRKVLEQMSKHETPPMLKYQGALTRPGQPQRLITSLLS